ncbi:MAG: hypothetical protein KAW14_07055 [Candidatus Aegiribacteria sp.]|nr:hypothetical protein [Candidatus Aegiribacteria sp.]
MKSIKGNYILGSAVNLGTGILFTALSLFWDTNMLVKGHYLYILGISALPLFISVFLVDRGYKPDEREEYLERKVVSYSWTVILMVLFGMYGLLSKHDPTAEWIIVMVCVALISKGGFGLYFFIRE